MGTASPPLALSTTGAPTTPIRPALERESESLAELTRSPFRVLLIEDNAADVMVVQGILQEQPASFEIVVASDGQEAIRVLREIDEDPSLEGFDIALLDLNLPKRTGHEVLAELRKTKRTGNLPVIIVTSSHSPRDIRRARELGANEYFEKVADLNAYSALGSLVMRTLERGSSAKGS